MTSLHDIFMSSEVFSDVAKGDLEVSSVSITWTWPRHSKLTYTSYQIFICSLRKSQAKFLIPSQESHQSFFFFYIVVLQLSNMFTTLIIFFMISTTGEYGFMDSNEQAVTTTKLNQTKNSLGTNAGEWLSYWWEGMPSPVAKQVSQYISGQVDTAAMHINRNINTCIETSSHSLVIRYGFYGFLSITFKTIKVQHSKVLKRIFRYLRVGLQNLRACLSYSKMMGKAWLHTYWSVGCELCL